MSNLYYTGTRDRSIKAAASEAILAGLAPDGGLFVPDHFPKLEIPLKKLAGMSYQETAYEVMRLFLTDFTEEELRACIAAAYDDKFDTEEIAPLTKAGDVWFLELYHGATIAFKDMALSILPHLLTTAARKNGVSDQIVILTATSGDTGKAALAGFEDVPGTKIMVFYPKHGVSPIQERQMVTQTGSNVNVTGILGNFDDAQSAVKAIFTDPDMRGALAQNGYRFSSANSINIGRLIPQVVYYAYSYGRLVAEKALEPGRPMNVTVPTGNFGNILAAYYAGQIGIPIGKYICASNENRVLFDFFETGTYDRNREFILTTSPSMDILISSNLERLIYEAAGQDAGVCASLMKDLAETGVYHITDDMKARLADFAGGYATVSETAARIRKVYERDGYLCDPHTAVASAVCEAYRARTGDTTPMVVVSTASPFKFTRSVLDALGKAEEGSGDLELADMLSAYTGIPVPEAVKSLKDARILHDHVVERGAMEDAVRKFLGI